MVEVELGAVGAQIVVPIEHEDVLDDDAVGLAVILVLTDLIGPGGGPIHNLQVLVLAVDQLAPAGLVETEDQIAVLVLVGGLHGGAVAGIDLIGVQADGEAGLLGLFDQPVHTLGGVGVGIDPDGIAGIIRRKGRRDQCEHHDQREHKSKYFLHVSSPSYYDLGMRPTNHYNNVGTNNQGVEGGFHQKYRSWKCDPFA